jgi:cytidylate kinase
LIFSSICRIFIRPNPVAMQNALITYFDQRFDKKSIVKTSSGPFITMSRETGCNATGIAGELVKALRNENKSWKFINKEILEESANKLKIDQSKIRYVFESKRKSHIDEVITALSNRYYKSDKIVRKTISEILQHYATEGQVIIIGRAGIATTRHIQNGLHLRFVAPYSWRVQSLLKRKEFKNENIDAFIREHDQKKKNLMEDFYGKDFTNIEFDLTINCAAFNRQQIISLILETMKLKGLI